MGMPLYGFDELSAQEQREAMECGDWFPADGEETASNPVRETHDVHQAAFCEQRAA